MRRAFLIRGLLLATEVAGAAEVRARMVEFPGDAVRSGRS